MWPVILDTTKEESMQSLRNLELQAYAQLVSALRAQGPLSSDKRQLLKDTSLALNITHDRQKAEIRRAINDEHLNTIAYHVTGSTDTCDDWAQEGRRSVPIFPRLAPQTAFSAIADEIAETANLTNQKLPPPACTERKRPLSAATPVLAPELAKNAQFRVPDTPKSDDSTTNIIKKRKLSINPENSTLAQHLLGTSKPSRSQAIYRQRPSKAQVKEAPKAKPALKAPFSPHLQTPNGPKADEGAEQGFAGKAESAAANENQAPRNKVMRNFTNLNFKQISAGSSSAANDTGAVVKNFKLCAAKKTINKVVTTTSSSALGQKLIVVSNAQTMQNNSILQKSLSLPLVKNISVKNLDKFKIVTTSSSSASVTFGNSLNALKHKVVTMKGASGGAKKVIPLSLLGSKGGIKVLPIGGKIVGKTTTTTSAASPLYIVSTVGATAARSNCAQVENGRLVGDVLQASGVTTDDFDAQIAEFRIPNNNNICGVGEGAGKELDKEAEEIEVESVVVEEEVVEEIVQKDGLLEDGCCDISKEVIVDGSDMILSENELFARDEENVSKTLTNYYEETVILPVECSDLDLIESSTTNCETTNEIGN